MEIAGESTFLPCFGVLLFCTRSWHPSVFCIFVLFIFLCFWFFDFLYFCIFVLNGLFYFLDFCTFKFGQTVHMNFHVKSEVCSSKKAELWVLCTFYVCTLFRQSIQTSIQNLESLAQKISVFLAKSTVSDLLQYWQVPS